jgi:putative transposase
MPRRLVPFVPEGYYHIYNRGNNRGAIFFEQENYLYFLQGMKRYLLPAVDIIAYCLMPTHYHFMTRVKQASEVSKTSEASAQFSLAMQKFLISYTKAINKRYKRVGALFQGAFHAKPITNSSHLLHLCCYIHANPVKDGLVADPSNWPYSNYLEWIGERDGTLVDHDFIQTQFVDPKDYMDFVLDYLQTRKIPEDVMQYLNVLEA